MIIALLTNVLFWSGIAIGGVVFAALLEVTGGEWAGPVRVSAERFRYFLPVSFVLILILMWQSSAIYPWADGSVPGLWFRPWFVALRVDAVCAIVYVAAFWFCRASRRARESGDRRSTMTVAVTFLIVYVLGFSLFVVDTIMSLEPHWTSTLFPAYVFTGNVYAAMASVATLAAWDIGTSSTEMSPARSRDVANLLLGASLFWLYLFWSQFLVIWYGNLTSEVGYVTVRLTDLRMWAWTVLALSCVIPFVVFVPPAGKRLTALRIVAPAILGGLWIERWMLVAPAVRHTTSTATAIVTTAAFAAVFISTVRRR